MLTRNSTVRLRSIYDNTRLSVKRASGVAGGRSEVFCSVIRDFWCERKIKLPVNERENQNFINNARHDQPVFGHRPLPGVDA